MTAPSAADELAAFIRTLLVDPELALSPTTPLISSGLLDSYSLVEVIVHVESRHGVKLPPSMRTKERLDTIERILAAIEGLGARTVSK